MRRFVYVFGVVFVMWLVVFTATFVVVGPLWAGITTVPFVPFVYIIGREWMDERE